MNKRTRDKLYPIISKRDGEYCKCCGKLPHEAELIIDHRDNNNTNNTLTNLQLLCRSCNYLKNPRKEPLDLCVNKKENNLDESCLSKNKRTEPAFREFIIEEIEKDDWHSLDWNKVIDMGAEKIGISQMTAERYLKKMITKYGPLRLYEGSNGFKSVAMRYFEDTKKSPQIYQW